jgi:hypothetical protein
MHKRNPKERCSVNVQGLSRGQSALLLKVVVVATAWYLFRCLSTVSIVLDTPEQNPDLCAKAVTGNQQSSNGETLPTKSLSREAPYGEYCETRPIGEKETWNFHKKVISYALFLPSQHETLPEWLMEGTAANAEVAKLYYPDWVL